MGKGLPGKVDLQNSRRDVSVLFNARVGGGGAVRCGAARTRRKRDGRHRLMEVQKEGCSVEVRRAETGRKRSN